MKPGLALILALLATAARADVVTLKDGRVLEGEITQEDDTIVKLKMSKGAMTIHRADIEKIERKPTPEQEYKLRLAKIDPKKIADRLALGDFASNHGMESEAVEQYHAAWALDAKSEAAAAGLRKHDWHFEDGKWLGPDEYYPRMGYRKFEGKWYKPLEYEWKAAVREYEKKDSERKKSEAALAAWRSKLQGMDRRKAAAEGRIDAARRNIDGAQDDLRLADEKTRQTGAGLAEAQNNSDLTSSDVGKKQKAQAALDVAKQKNAKAKKAADTIREKIEKYQKDIETANDEIYAIGQEKVAAEAEIPALEEDLKRATAAATEEKVRADEAKAAFENSR
jgi:hypothetical protein